MRTSSDKLKWLQSEIEKDKKELDLEKLKLINQIKSLKKEELLPKKLSLWKRILRLFTE